MLLLLLLALQLAVDEDRVWRGRVGGRGRGTGRLEGARRVGPAADATVHGGNGDESSEAEATSRTRLVCNEQFFRSSRKRWNFYSIFLKTLQYNVR